jgi:hypothetical protein
MSGSGVDASARERTGAASIDRPGDNTLATAAAFPKPLAALRKERRSSLEVEERSIASLLTRIAAEEETTRSIELRQTLLRPRGEW